MRVIYRLVAGGVALIVAVATGVVLLVTRDDSPATVTAAAEPTVKPTSGTPSGDALRPTASPGTGVSAAPGAAASATGGPTASSASAAPTPEATPAASAPATVEPATAGSGASATAAPTPKLKPIDAALADPRIPGPPKNKKLGKLPGRTIAVKRWIKDRRSRIAVARMPRIWKPVKSAPFATRQVLPAVKGAGHRALLVSCPVPILVQKELRDTAIVAARWTLNHQPKGAKIKWVASQPKKVGKRDAWLLAYEVKYTVKGKRRTSMAAVVLTEIPKHKPALLFVSIPDSQKKRWRDINTVISTLKAA
ncbi:hypothetical protein AB0K60_00640 [Thermopolyspora sp. NPDC052614]|uniref:hypothetical protein n=1 Tax=Thermopolyspora sp. NPDC052614 TaxID=3155682 RepID=UPI0034196BA9